MTVFFASDFETTTNPNETEVWLAGFIDIIKFNSFNDVKYQSNIKDFLKELYLECFNQYSNKKENDFVCFFHNLRFDGSFLLNFFIENNIEHTHFINDMGVWYSITIEFPEFKITFRDSLKILNFSIREMAKLFNMPIAKGETPLLDKKPDVIADDWVEYLKVDIIILARALYAMYFEEDFTKFTSASEALKEFKKIFTKNNKRFRDYFPLLNEEVDLFCRKGYRGGWTFANPITQNRVLRRNIEIYDINSMYPSVMLNSYLPIGYPTYKKGKPKIEKDKLYLYHVQTSFSLKKNYLPTIQIKDKQSALKINVRTSDYVVDTNGEVVDLYLTQFDYELFDKHYNHFTVFVETLIFDCEKGLFDDYISTYRYKKENAKSQSEKQKAKIMLNSLYGKFGAKIVSRKKSTYLENGVLKFKTDDEEEVEPVYVPIALFVTSIARHFIISSAQNNYKNFLYADTDSLHLFEDKKLNLDIHPTEFGKWALEGKAIKAKYLRSKLYIEEIIKDDGTTFLDVKGAGMTPEIKKQITFDNFKIGNSFKGKKSSKQIKGGVHIFETEFTIKEHDYII